MFMLTYPPWLILIFADFFAKIFHIKITVNPEPNFTGSSTETLVGVLSIDYKAGNPKQQSYWIKYFIQNPSSGSEVTAIADKDKKMILKVVFNDSKSYQ